MAPSTRVFYLFEGSPVLVPRPAEEFVPPPVFGSFESVSKKLSMVGV